MPTDVEAVATEPIALTAEQQKVVNALNNGKYVWRTVDGVAKETGLSTEVVLPLLRGLPPNLVASTDGPQGQLFTTREHYYGSQTLWGRFLTAFTGKFK
jgi:hypothetical protein